MKKIFLSLLIVALAAGAVVAQPPARMKMKMKHDKMMAMKKLNLTSDQKAKFQSINEDFRKQMEDLKKQDQLTVKEWKSRREKLQKDRAEKMQSLLTVDQKDQLKKMKDLREAEMKTRTTQRMDMMKQRLSLSDEQSAKFKTLHSETEQKMKAIHENKALSMEQKKEQSKELMKQNKEKMKSILTDEQLKKLKEGKERKMERGKRKVTI